MPSLSYLHTLECGLKSDLVTQAPLKDTRTLFPLGDGRSLALLAEKI